MRISSLQLYNFRQFYGTTPKLEFGVGQKSITVIHASNGAGKTALLNAFTWTLYERFSPGFLLPDQLINKRAVREADPGSRVEAWVKLQFDHEGYQYEILRRVTGIKSLESDVPIDPVQELQMLRAGPDGDWKPLASPASAIGRILPEALHRYFFFDGERIEKIVSPDKEAQKELVKATKMFLGVEVLDRAERHLKSTLQELEGTLKAIGDPETKRLLEEKSERVQALEEIADRIAQHDRNIEGGLQRQTAIRASLRELESAKALQKRREHLERDKGVRKKSQSENVAMLKEEITTRGYTVFLGSSTERYLSLLRRLEQKGELPAGIKINFVNDLLEQQRCICGTCLDDSHPGARSAVESWKLRAGLVDVEDKALRMKGEITQIQRELDSFWQRIDQIQKKRESDREELARIEMELDDISTKLRGSGQQQVSDLETQLADAEQAVKGWDRDKVLDEHRANLLRSDIAEIDRQIGRQENKEARQKVAQRRVTATRDAIGVVIQVRSLLEAQMRASLEHRIQRLFNRISVTPYVPSLTEDYTLRLLESAGGKHTMVAASQGENQLLSFSFIGAVVEEAKAWSGKKSSLPGPNSSQYPIVMDSPFGALDPVYRRNVAEHLRLLADQVVLLVTKTQWREEVQVAVEPSLGKQYVVTYFSPREEIDPDYIDVRSERYRTIARSPDDFEYSIIERI